MVSSIRRIINTAKFLPPVTRDSEEVQEVQRIATEELQRLHDYICEVYMNQWIVTMTEYGLSQWEKIFDVIPMQDDSLDDRRQRIFRLIKGERPYTIRSFQRLLNSVWGANKINASLVHEKYELWLNVHSDLNYDVENIYQYTDEIVPKNLAIMFRNRHEGNCNYYMSGIVSIRKITDVGWFDLTTDSVHGNQYMGGYVHVHKPVIIIKERS